MDRAVFKRMEFFSVAVVMLAGIALMFSYEFTEKSILSVVFGAVNGSFWEQVKCFVMPYIVWGILEIAFARPYFKTFVVSKVIGLYIFFFGTLLSSWAVNAVSGIRIPALTSVLAAVFLIISSVVSYRLTLNSSRLRVWFVFSLFALMLFGAMYFSFTAVAPHMSLFIDPKTGSSGIPPMHLDTGAFYLDELNI